MLGMGCVALGLTRAVLQIGGDRCPVIDTWWQTETGAAMLTPLPGCTPTKPGSAAVPFFGVKVHTPVPAKWGRGWTV